MLELAFYAGELAITEEGELLVSSLSKVYDLGSNCVIPAVTETGVFLYHVSVDAAGKASIYVAEVAKENGPKVLEFLEDSYVKSGELLEWSGDQLWYAAGVSADYAWPAIENVGWGVKKAATWSYGGAVGIYDWGSENVPAAIEDGSEAAYDAGSYIYTAQCRYWYPDSCTVNETDAEED